MTHEISTCQETTNSFRFIIFGLIKVLCNWAIFKSFGYWCFHFMITWITCKRKMINNVPNRRRKHVYKSYSNYQKSISDFLYKKGKKMVKFLFRPKLKCCLFSVSRPTQKNPCDSKDFIAVFKLFFFISEIFVPVHSVF